MIDKSVGCLKQKNVDGFENLNVIKANAKRQILKR